MEKLISKASKFVVKEMNDDKRIVKGMASVFDNLDSDMDVMQKGAFTKTISERGPEGKNRIKLWAQHKMDKPIGRILKMEETKEGLYIEAKFGTHRDGEDYYRMAKEGIVDEFSVGFIPVKKEGNEMGGYDIKEIALHEVSMVSFAANDEAIVTEVKSATLDNMANLVSKIEDKDLADELETGLLKISALLDETSTKPESDLEVKEGTTEPEVKKEDTLEDSLAKLNKLF